MTCLDDETVLGLVEGRLDAGLLAGVDDHLDTCNSCRDVVSHVARMQTTAHVIERGYQLGRYVVGDVIGAGAMGRVYSAWDPELDRRVAIKVLQDDAPGARERLVREGKAMARLDHANVVGVHEVGTSEHGVYVAMDLVDGETLRAWAVRGRTWRQIARVLADVARGLAGVHAAGVLHRDMKPDNAFIGGDGRARIGDFGLARSGPSPTTPVPDRRVDGSNLPIAQGTPTSIAGTPAYMAPEVLRGGAATEASDQFGFGVSAYEVIAGHRPFEGKTWSELLRSIEKTPPSKLRDVPGWLDALVRRCLAVDPAKRFPTMTAISDALDDGARARRPMWIAAAAGAAIVASGATWFALRGSQHDGPSCAVGADEIAAVWNPTKRATLKVDAPSLAAIDRWAASWIAARDGICRAAATDPAPLIAARDRCLERRRDELAALLARVTTYDTTPERLVDALAAFPPSECMTLALGSADPIPLDPQKAAAVRAIESELPAIRAAIALGDARPIAQTLLALVERAKTAGHAPTLAAVLLLGAEALRTMSSLPEATLAARDAAAAAERGHDDLAAAYAWVERVTIAGDRRELAAAEDLATMAAAAIDRAGSPPRLAAKLLHRRGLVAFNRGALDDARKLLNEARALYVTASGERSIDVSAVEASLGTVERQAGDLDAAEKHHKLALSIDKELRGELHPDLARDLHNLAGLARLRGELSDAQDLYTQALYIEIKTRGKDSVQAALTHNSLGLVHMATNNNAAAITEIVTARDIFKASGHGDFAFTEHNLGLIFAATGENGNAIEHFDIAEEAYRNTIGMDAAAPIRLRVDRAAAKLETGDLAAARADAIAARTLAQKANILWIVDEADKILVRTKPLPRPYPPKTYPVEPLRPPVSPLTIEPPKPIETPPLPKPPEDKKPQPLKDVGVYGSSQGW